MNPPQQSVVVERSPGVWERVGVVKRPASADEEIVLRRRRRKRAGGRTRPERHVGQALILWYRHRAYRLLGERLDKRADAMLEARLRQAGMNWSPGLFSAMAIMTAGLAFAAAWLVLVPVFWFLFPPLAAIGYAVGAAAATGLTTFAVFRGTLGTRIQNRRNELEKELPFTLSELAVMASIGISPIEILRRMARRDHDPALTQEFRKVVHKTDVQGKDAITALGETAKECPSQKVRETFWDMGNMIHQGGDLGEYIKNQADEVLDLKRVRQKEFIDRLTTYSDMYVTVVLIGVIFVGIGAFVIDAFGSTAGGLSADMLLMLLSYGAIPLVIAVVAILLSTAYGRVD